MTEDSDTAARHGRRTLKGACAAAMLATLLLSARAQVTSGLIVPFAPGA